MSEVSVKEEIDRPLKLRPHLVLIGAGASRAALPNGDRDGRCLPLMADLVDTIPSVRDVLENADLAWRGRNFEEVYSALVDDPSRQDVARAVEEAVYKYFRAMKLPDDATIYDALILSLRSKDVVATFNWDPFLIQAWRRSVDVTESLPYLLFLHGNVAHGYCVRDEVSGVNGGVCSRCGTAFAPDRLLYPVAKKDYSSNPSIHAAWDGLHKTLEDTLFVTIFGYGAPASDADAVALMDSAWGGWRKRQFDQIDFIDIRDEVVIRATWSRFIHTHHYEVFMNFWDSFLANHPRRTIEAYFNQYIEAKLIENNPVPRTTSLTELHAWFRNLIDAEGAAGV